jgi:RNA polymerase sigma-70 factor (sigma-E family)
VQEFTEYVAGRMTALRRSAYLLCGSWHQADDLVQAVLADLYERWARARRADNLDAYVHTILVRRYLDDRRTGWTRRVRLVDHSLDRADPAEADVFDRVDFVTAIATLPARQRAVVVLRFYEDLTVEQVAEVLRIRPGTVKSYSARALDTLRRLLDADPQPSGDHR